MLDHREMETLIAIIDGQSFDSAARHLNISPGAVSQRIKSLENRLGRSVLIRSTPPKTTAAGEQVLTYARRLLLIQKEMGLALKNNLDADVLSLTIAVNHDSLSCWFLDVVSSLSDKPHLSFDIRTSNTISTQELLKSGEVIAAITSKNNQVAGCKTRYLGKLEYIPVCSQSFFKSHFSSDLGKAQLASAPIVLFDRNDDLVKKFLSLYKLQADQVKTHYIPCSHILLDAIKRGIGWTMLPRLLIEDQLTTSELVTIAPHSLFIELYWNTWEQVSETITQVENQVISIASKKLVQ
ncbi:ArgP/LysG family DNA-binding transcriptional regulator [Photobacterium sanctipauli]|uniref:ArgP/LysG family DNA-binding transcriptional regulator n=1 Tax=Photobacterium sanctipauli TaxID=1342794 RepID=A0A2T3NWN6_9GAMM|nr:ArgP/LysG family DNA-binding transcriptional regulator [Photobacterium sanctipauli]PSW20707.1 ArgP/LysG family DNA-binding transcriptional regulator [Photobacterium sanctipauli]